MNRLHLAVGDGQADRAVGQPVCAISAQGDADTLCVGQSRHHNRLARDRVRRRPGLSLKQNKAAPHSSLRTTRLSRPRLATHKNEEPVIMATANVPFSSTPHAAALARILHVTRSAWALDRHHATLTSTPPLSRRARLARSAARAARQRRCGG